MTKPTALWWLVVAAASASAAVAIAAPPPTQAPTGWTFTGQDFDVAVDRSVRHRGPASAHLACREEMVDDFGALIQTLDAKRYRGSRLRLSGWIKSALGKGHWAGLWMRVDGPGVAHKHTLAFDNMMGRPIRGATDWTRYEVVLDVPEEAARVAFGALVARGGEIWVDGLALEEVGDDVPTTQPTQEHRWLPINLDFEEGSP